VRVTDAAVNDGYDHVVGGGRVVPALGRVNIRIGFASVLAGVVKSPQCPIGKSWVVRIRDCRVNDVVRSAYVTCPLLWKLSYCSWTLIPLRPVGLPEYSQFRVAPQDASAKLRMKDG